MHEVLGFANFRFVDPRLNASPCTARRSLGSFDESDRFHPARVHGSALRVAEGREPPTSPKHLNLSAWPESAQEDTDEEEVREGKLRSDGCAGVLQFGIG